MKTTDLVVDFLRKQGFCPNVMDDGNVTFKHEMASFLFINNENDEDFFQLVMPHICDVTEDNREVMLEAANKVCAGIKVVKACIINDGVWLFFENLLDSTPDVSDITPRALQILHGARRQFYEFIS